MTRFSIQMFVLLSSIWFLGCDGGIGGFMEFKKEETPPNEEKDPLARVKDKYLYPEDIQGIINSEISRGDTSDIIHRYIKNWVKKQLLIDEAATRIEFDMAEIERKILDYRYALMVHEFEKYYVNQNINRNISDEDISAYYDEHKQNFELKHNIIQGLYAKVPKEAPNTATFRSMMRGNISDKTKEDIKSYCFRFAADYSLDDTVWLNFEEVIKNTPWMGVSNKEEILGNNKFVEISDDNFFYFLKLFKYKTSNEISPLSFVQNDIRRIILNKRKINITGELKEEIYKNAKTNNEFEIFIEPPENRLSRDAQ